MRIGFFQYDVAHDAEKNLNRLKFYLQQQKCEIVVLPELSMCGYLFENRSALFSCAETIPSGRSTQAMLAISRQHSCTIIFGLAEKEDFGLCDMDLVKTKANVICSDFSSEIAFHYPPPQKN